MLYLVMPLALAAANLAVFYNYVVPALWPHDGIAYANFWANYGATPLRAVAGMVLHPTAVVRDVITSGFLRIVLPPFLFLPAVGWRWSLGTLPLVIVFAASANDQVHAFGIYYAVYLVPFLALAAADGARVLAGCLLPSAKQGPIAAAVLVLSTLVTGPGYVLRPWLGTVSAVHDAVALLREESVILVQSELYPHAGYDSRVQLLTPYALATPTNQGAALLMVRGGRAYPFADAEFARLQCREAIPREMPKGLVAVRNRANAACSEGAAVHSRRSRKSRWTVRAWESGSRWMRGPGGAMGRHGHRVPGEHSR
jgi:hypothetical protein